MMLIVDGGRKCEPGLSSSQITAVVGWVIMENNVEKLRGRNIICASSAMQTEGYALLYGIKNVVKDQIQSL